MSEKVKYFHEKEGKRGTDFSQTEYSGSEVHFLPSKSKSPVTTNR